MNDVKAHPYYWAVNGPPLGVWQTDLGTASALMRDAFTMRSDGTGELREVSMMQGERVSPFIWQHSDPGVLCIQASYGGEPVENDEWETIRYCADWSETDVGSACPVLRNLDSDRFWILVGSVQLVKRAD